MFCEVALPRHREKLGPLVVQVDVTVVEEGPATGRAQHALTGAMLSAEQMEAENVGQDAGEGRRRILAMPREGRRPRVVLPRREKGRERLEVRVRLIAGEDPLEPTPSTWATSVAPTPDQDGGCV
jgi:hypothetical protein